MFLNCLTQTAALLKAQHTVATLEEQHATKWKGHNAPFSDDLVKAMALRDGMTIELADVTVTIKEEVQRFLRDKELLLQDMFAQTVRLEVELANETIRLGSLYLGEYGAPECVHAAAAPLPAATAVTTDTSAPGSTTTTVVAAAAASALGGTLSTSTSGRGGGRARGGQTADAALTVNELRGTTFLDGGNPYGYVDPQAGAAAVPTLSGYLGGDTHPLSM